MAITYISDPEITGYEVTTRFAGKATTHKTEATKFRIIESSPNLIAFSQQGHDVLIVPAHDIVSIKAIHAAAVD